MSNITAEEMFKANPILPEGVTRQAVIAFMNVHTKQNIEALRSELLKGVNEENFVYEVINLRINQFLENIN